MPSTLRSFCPGHAAVVACLALTGALATPAGASAAVTLGADLSTTPNYTDVCSPGGMLPGCNMSPIQSAGVNQAATFDGVVVRWRAKMFSGPIKLRVIRPFGGTNYTFVSSGAVETGTGAGIDTFAARLPIKVGDYVGVEFTSPTSQFSVDSGGTRPGDRNAVWASINPDGSSSNATIAEGGRVYMNADVEPDVDQDGFGDETQDQCPTDAAVQGACPVPDRAAPIARLKGRSRQDIVAQRGVIIVDATLDEDGTATARARVSVPKLSKLYRTKSVTKSLLADQQVRFRLKLGRKAFRNAKRALADDRRVRAVIRLVAEDAAGNEGSIRKTIRLRD